MQATTALPEGYRQQAILDLSESKTATAGAIGLGIVLLIGVGWLLVQFTRLLRPAALEGIRFRNMLTVTPGGGLSLVLPPLVETVVAFVLVTLIHELVHGAFFWWFTGQRPTFGVKGLFVYAAASPEVYVPRNQGLMVGIAPLVLLTLVGLLLMLIAPVVAVPLLSLFIVFNAAGAAGDLVMAVRFLSYSPDTLMQDSGTGVVVYGPENG